MLIERHVFTPYQKIAHKRSPWMVIHLLLAGSVNLTIGRQRYVEDSPAMWVTSSSRPRFSYRFGASPGEKWYIGFAGVSVPVWEARQLLPTIPYPLKEPDNIMKRVHLLNLLSDEQQESLSSQRALLLEELLLALANDRGERVHYAGHWAEELMKQFANPSCPPPDATLLAQRIGCSVPTIRRQFKAVTGRRLVEAWNEVRLELAAGMLLNSDVSIADLGRACGYQDPLYFSRLFRAHFQLSPRAFRRQFRNLI